MSGNSKQRHKARRTGIRIATKMRDMLHQAIRPMIKDECLKEFDECVTGLTEIVDDLKKSNTMKDW
jgi:hypothetical protein